MSSVQDLVEEEERRARKTVILDATEFEGLKATVSALLDGQHAAVLAAELRAKHAELAKHEALDKARTFRIYLRLGS